MTQSSTNVDRKTDTKVQNSSGVAIANRAAKRKVSKKIIENELNKYRNVTYNFTISAVPSEWLVNAKYRTEKPKYIILKSGGKGTNNFPMLGELSKLQSSAIESRVNIENSILDRFSARIRQESFEKKSTEQTKIYQGQIEGFNKESPGRFDMFIDDVEIDGIMSFGKPNGASLATKLNFSVVEPYSINGFIEALHISSIAAGYISYTMANFLLTVEFWGYPDNVDVSESTPVKIGKPKFLLFKLSAVKVDITEQGTKYQCNATLFSDRAFGNPNKLKKPISMEGSTVKEILEDLVRNVEKQVQESDNESQPGSTKYHDEYEIKFPILENGKFKYTEEGNAIGKSRIAEFNKSNVLSVMPDQDKSTISSPRVDNKKPPSAEEVKKDPNKIKYTPNSKIKVQFNAGRNLSECIEAVIVDSNYVKGLLENFKPDEYGLVNYFLITPEVTNLSEINPQTRDYYKKYIFNVTEYKVHYTRIPGYQSFKFDIGNISNLIYKEYNYIYTGKNIDVLNFKLDFNNLYFESIPYALGNNDFSGARNTAVKANNPKIEYRSESTSKIVKDQTSPPAERVDVTPINPIISGTGGQLTDDPYQILSRNMHDAIINAKVSGAQGTLEILGDPFFISTTGTGNYKATLLPGYLNVTEDNEIDMTFGEIYILVNFRNPIDVNQFAKNRVPFSGVYRIIDIKSSFKSGIFKQELKLIRLPAQIPEEQNIEPTDPTTVAVTNPDPDNQIVDDSSPVISGPGLRPDPTQLSIPTVNSPGFRLAGQTVNFVNQGISQLSAASSVFGQTQSKLSEGIRLASTNINSSLESLATLKSAGEQLGSAIGNPASAAKNILSTFGGNSPLVKIVGELPNTNNLVGGLVNKLKDGIQEQLLANLAGDLGINPNNLFSLGKEKLEGLKAKAEDLSVNIPRAVTSGIKLDTIPVDKLTNIPLLAPPTQAPVPDIPLQDIKGLDVSRAFGVTDIKKLPGGITPDKINEAISAGAGIGGKLLAGKLGLPADLTSAENKFSAVAGQTSSVISQARQSLESAQASLGSLNISSAANLFGSKTLSSPLDKLLTPQTQNLLPPSG